MDRKLVVQLERLLSELADEGASQERVGKIESLLLDNPELQDHYWSWMDIHVILGTDRTAILGESNTANPLVALSSEEDRPQVVQRAGSPSRSRTRWWLVPALAVSACLVWLLLSDDFSWRRIANQLNPNLGSADETETWRIPKITRVSWEGPYFAERELNDSVTEAHVGLVSLGFVDGLPANGYVLRLEPGTTAELMMAADAYAENNLSVTELNPTGTPVRRSVSFNNFGAGAISGFGEISMRTRRYGLIGTWSEFNDTDKPKYYLLNGIHKSSNPDLPASNAEQEFQLSKMVVAIDEPDLVLIGWDDGGIQPSEKSAGVEADGDYDDISVVIRISGRGIEQVHSDEGCRTIAQSVSTLEAPQTDGSDRYQFTLVPGELAVLNVASEARKTNSVYLVNEATGDILWSANNTTSASSNLGAIAIQNTGEQQMDLAIFGENSSFPPAKKAEWETSLVSTIHSQPGCTILGFEDQEGDSGDFDDIRVTLFSLSLDRNTPIENPSR